MNLVSCDRCGVVVDTDVISFPELMYNEHCGLVNEKVAVWSERLCDFTPAALCPVCHERGITKNE